MSRPVTYVVSAIFLTSSISRSPPEFDLFGGLVEDIIESEPNRHGKYKVALPKSAKKWDQLYYKKKYIVPYEFKSHYNKEELEVILKAMRAIANNTCIEFRPRKDVKKKIKKAKDKSYVEFLINSTRCGSKIGRVDKYANKVYLSRARNGTCIVYRIVLHELFHVLGLKHEHNRADRDKYVKIYLKHVKQKRLHDFLKVDKAYKDYGTKYNYRSIMHYRKNAFSKDKKLVVMKTTDPKYQDIIGRVDDAAATDYHQICKLYNCKTCIRTFSAKIRKEFGWK